MLPTMHDVLTPAGVLRYAAGGPEQTRKPTLVLLHPWFGSWRFWLPLVDRLDERRWVAPDLYSLADSRVTATPEVLAKAVAALIDGDESYSVDIVGNSVGGIVAQIVAAASPDRVRTLTLVGTGARTAGTRPEFAAVVDAWVAGTPHDNPAATRIAVARAVDMLTKYPAPSHIRDATISLLIAAPRQYVASVLSGARCLDLRPQLSNVTAPTMIVRGAQDCARTPAHVAELLDRLPNARAVELSDAGHCPMIDAPGEFATLLLQHLTSPLLTRERAL